MAIPEPEKSAVAEIDPEQIAPSLPTTAVADSNGPTRKHEIWAWYAYDWANSPFWQVADTIMKWLLKRLAEYAKAAGDFSFSMSPGSYPAFIMWLTAAVQVVALLSFSAFADYGRNRKRLLKILTFGGCVFLWLCILCFSPKMWWLAGVLRVFVGICFSLTTVFYNSFLPLLTAQHPDVLALQGTDAAKREAELSDEISSKGFAFGYCGGMIVQLLSYLLFLSFECSSNCGEFDRLFLFALCVSLVGVWWGAFSLYTFKHLKDRDGPPFPEGNNRFCLGWVQAWNTLCVLVRRRQILIFMIAYFIWSDALTTALNVSVLYMDETDKDNSGEPEGKDSAKMVLLAVASLVGIVGVVLFAEFQKRSKLTNKTIILGQLMAYGIVCIACACGGLDGGGYYVLMALVTIMMGSLQAFTRSLFSSLTPVGMEAAMFAFYAITDKGSSLVGAAVIGVVHTSTGSYIGVFWYCVLAFAGSAVLLCFVDVNQGMVDAGKNRDSKIEPTIPGPDASSIGAMPIEENKNNEPAAGADATTSTTCS